MQVDVELWVERDRYMKDPNLKNINMEDFLYVFLKKKIWFTNINSRMGL